MPSMFKSFVATAPALALALALASATPSQAADRPFNRVAIMIDASGSYRARQGEAVARASALLAGLAEQRHERWERADEILIISLDAAPEVIWRGTPAELSATDRNEWIVRFRGRSDYAACTDVAAGLNLAARELNAAPAATAQYLFAFSDLIDERPVQGVSTCAPPRATPGDDVAWGMLTQIRIAAFWLPVDQKMAWDAEMRAHGLTSYRLLSTSESGVNRIDIPEPARHEVTDEERAQSRSVLTAAAKSVGLFLASLVGLVVLGAAGLAFLASRRRARRALSASTVARPHGVPVQGPVAPMRIPPKV